jgi:hypothetical protein
MDVAHQPFAGRAWLTLPFYDGSRGSRALSRGRPCAGTASVPATDRSVKVPGADGGQRASFSYIRLQEGSIKCIPPPPGSGGGGCRMACSWWTAPCAPKAGAAPWAYPALTRLLLLATPLDQVAVSDFPHRIVVTRPSVGVRTPGFPFFAQIVLLHAAASRSRPIADRWRRSVGVLSMVVMWCSSRPLGVVQL